MAQNFRRYTSNDVGTSAATLFTANSYDTVVGISVANITTSSVVASVYINDGANDIYLVKDAPIPSGSSLQVLDGGAKFVVQSGDALKVVSDTASSLDVWVSTVDNDGDALTTGDLYFNTGSNELKVYNGSSWQVAAVDASSLASNGFAIAMAIAL